MLEPRWTDPCPPGCPPSRPQVLQSCLVHIIHKGRYISSNYTSAFFRAEHNASEMEAYCGALCQLRALLHLAQQLLHDNVYGQLYSLEDGSLSRQFVHEYSSMRKACFYGRCLGFQVRPGAVGPWSRRRRADVVCVAVLPVAAALPPDGGHQHGGVRRDIRQTAHGLG